MDSSFARRAPGRETRGAWVLRGALLLSVISVLAAPGLAPQGEPRPSTLQRGDEDVVIVAEDPAELLATLARSSALESAAEDPGAREAVARATGARPAEAAALLAAVRAFGSKGPRAATFRAALRGTWVLAARRREDAPPEPRGLWGPADPRPPAPVDRLLVSWSPRGLLGRAAAGWLLRPTCLRLLARARGSGARLHDGVLEIETPETLLPEVWRRHRRPPSRLLLGRGADRSLVLELRDGDAEAEARHAPLPRNAARALDALVRGRTADDLAGALSELGTELTGGAARRLFERRPGTPLALSLPSAESSLLEVRIERRRPALGVAPPLAAPPGAIVAVAFGGSAGDLADALLRSLVEDRPPERLARREADLLDETGAPLPSATEIFDEGRRARAKTLLEETLEPGIVLALDAPEGAERIEPATTLAARLRPDAEVRRLGELFVSLDGSPPEGTIPLPRPAGLPAPPTLRFESEGGEVRFGLGAAPRRLALRAADAGGPWLRASFSSAALSKALEAGLPEWIVRDREPELATRRAYESEIRADLAYAVGSWPTPPSPDAFEGLVAERLRRRLEHHREVAGARIAARLHLAALLARCGALDLSLEAHAEGDALLRFEIRLGSRPR